MDFLKKAMDSVESNDDSQKPTPEPQSQPQAHPQQTHHSSPTELLSSAKVLGDAAQSILKQENFDKAKVASAADDFVHAASEYGNLEEKGYGQYAEKAGTYLHKYGSGSAPATTTEHSAATTESTESAKPEPAATTESTESAKSEEGIGGYLKMAQGFMK